jgi:hypothetical protein
MAKPRSGKPAPIPLAKAPSSVIQKSLAHLHQSVAKHEKRLSLITKKQGEVRRRLNAPIMKLIDVDSHHEAVRRILSEFQNSTVMTGEHDGPPPFSTDEVQWLSILGGPGIALAVPPFQHHFAQPDTSSHAGGNFSDPDGNVSISVDPNSDGATAIAGVGFYFVVPDPSKTIARVRSWLSYSYNWYTLGSWGFTAHSEGQLGLLIHHFDQNNNFSEQFDFPDSFFWQVTSDGGHDLQQGTKTLDNFSPPLVVGDGYVFWTYARVYANSSDGWSHGHAELKMKCNLMTMDFIQP